MLSVGSECESNRDFAIVNDLLLILVVGPTFVVPIPNGDRLTLMNAKPI